MSGPDDPTRRVPPQEPREPHVRERVVEDDPWRAEIADRLRSLRTALVLVGVLAAVALGAAAYALVEATGEDEGDGRTPASASRVSDLEDEVEQLDERIDDRATKNDVSELRSDLEALDERVGELGEQAQQDGGDDGAQQAVDDLRGDVEELEQRVNDLEQQSP
jgi:polyhydroxyalkanoate synthesis regulator phasin